MAAGLPELAAYITSCIECSYFPKRHPDHIFSAFNRYRISAPKPYENWYKKCETNIKLLQSKPEKVQLLEKSHFKKVRRSTPRSLNYKLRGGLINKGRGLPRGRNARGRPGIRRTFQGRGYIQEGKKDFLQSSLNINNYHQLGKSHTRSKGWRARGSPNKAAVDKQWNNHPQKEKSKNVMFEKNGFQRLTDLKKIPRKHLYGYCARSLNVIIRKLENVDKNIGEEFTKKGLKRKKHTPIPSTVLTIEEVIKAQERVLKRVSGVAEVMKSLGINLNNQYELKTLYDRYDTLLKRVSLLERTWKR